MLNFIWPIFIIVSCIYGIFTGKVDEINNNIFESAAQAVQLTITFFGSICLWNGLMQIAIKTSLIEKLTKFLKPVILFLFPNINVEDKEFKCISMNIVANLLGLGNAATPLGLKAIQEMQKNNSKKETLSNSMIMFIVINTASLQLIPTTVIGIRNSLGAENSTEIIVPIWIASICSVITVITVTKLFIKIGKWYYREVLLIRLVKIEK